MNMENQEAAHPADVIYHLHNVRAMATGWAHAFT